MTINEQMVESKARTKFQQYMKDKPSKWGLKYWVISDPSAYTKDFNLYLSAAQSGRSEHGLAYELCSCRYSQSWHFLNRGGHVSHLTYLPHIKLDSLENDIKWKQNLRALQVLCSKIVLLK